MYVIPLENLTPDDRLVAGGKGVSLGVLLREGLNVPRGFVVTPMAFFLFLEENGLREIFQILISQHDALRSARSVRNFSKIFEQAIAKGVFPSFLTKEIEAASELLTSPHTIVRSSATTEDSTTSAVPGVLRSIVGTKRSVFRDIQRCWASFFSADALEYFSGKRLSLGNVALVVQEFIPGDVSGIGFSADPLGRDSGRIILQAVCGSGQAIVSGKAENVEFVADKKTFEVISEKRRPQRVIAYLGASGAIKLRKITEENSAGTSLSKDEAKELAFLIALIERRFGYPVDVEWTRKDGKFFIVQARPIIGSEHPQERWRPLVEKPMALSVAEVWSMSEQFVLPLFYQGISFSPIFIYRPGRGVTVLYRESDPRFDEQGMSRFYAAHPAALKRLLNFHNEKARELNELVSQKSRHWDRIGIALTELWPAITVLMAISSSGQGGIPKNLRGDAESARRKTENVPHHVFEFLLGWHEKKLRRIGLTGLPGYVSDLLTMREIMEKRYPSLKCMRERSRGWIYAGRAVLVGDAMDAFLRERAIAPEPTDAAQRLPARDSLRGVTAYPGHARGIVRKIYTHNQAENVGAGDILFTPSLEPKYARAARKAGGIITEDKGTLSHAAIFAREEQKPCIIAAAGADAFLVDGEEVFLDADNGYVTRVGSGDTQDE